jgi:hypothetical protein
VCDLIHLRGRELDFGKLHNGFDPHLAVRGFPVLNNEVLKDLGLPGKEFIHFIFTQGKSVLFKGPEKIRLPLLGPAYVIIQQRIPAVKGDGFNHLITPLFLV